MIRILVVEDDNDKFGKLFLVLKSSGVPKGNIVHCVTSSDAYAALKESHFDLMLLDVNLPRRHGSPATRGEGAEFLRSIRRDEAIMLPRYIVGVTAFEDVIAEFGEGFTEQLWSLVLYSDTTDAWKSQISTKIDYIQSAKKSDSFRDGRTYGIDLAIICALEGVEFDAVKALPCDWQPLRLPHDETRYISGTIGTEGKSFSVVAAAAPRMGMSASAVLSAKLIQNFRPRVLAMAGICAGRASKVRLGDIIVGDPVWDWGSGKIETEGNERVFRPAPHQIELDLELGLRLKEVCRDPMFLAKVKHQARGKKPDAELQIHFGPIVSGAVVVAHSDVVKELLEQHRGILGIDMEAYGVQSASLGSGKPRPATVIMKSVCDFADAKKSDDYQEFAAHTSALALYYSAADFLKN